jgi:uncharacterized protein YebE (UPF0316 family)
MKGLAAFLGFFEISIWLFAIAQVMQNLSSLDCYIAFAGGFSLGNFLGISIEGKLALGTVGLHVATRKNATPLIDALRAADYAVTAFDAQSRTDPVRVVITAVRRKELSQVISTVKSYDPDAFYLRSRFAIDRAKIFAGHARARARAIPRVHSPGFPNFPVATHRRTQRLVSCHSANRSPGARRRVRVKSLSTAKSTGIGQGGRHMNRARGERTSVLGS